MPAAIVTIWYGEKGTAQLLILSQVILSLQLPFAIVPLVMFTADRSKMGELIAPRWLTALAALTALIIIALNIKLLHRFRLALRPVIVQPSTTASPKPSEAIEAFLRQEAALVIHLARALDPIAKIDVGAAPCGARARCGRGS